MKNMCYAALLGFCTITSAHATSDAAPSREMEVRERADIAGAPLRSRAQLDAYLKSSVESPILRLGPEKTESFLKSLVFSRTGLASYSTLELEGLTTSEVYSILSLFGMQSGLATVEDRRVVSSDDEAVEAYVAMLGTRVTPRQVCILSPNKPGRCVENPKTNCSSNCTHH